jgi:hypothetical protein
MIEINLLPPELRPIERTPLPRLLVWCVGLAAILAGGSLLAFMHVKWLPALQRRSKELDQQIAQKQALAAQADKLKREIEEIAKRQRAVEQLWKARTVWWIKLDQLVDLVPEYVGLDSLSFKPAAVRAARAEEEESAGKLAMRCICSYPEEARLAEFRNRLKGVIPIEEASEPEVGKRFIADFYLEIVDQGWEQKKAPPGFEQEWILEFPLELNLKPKLKPAAPPAPAAPGAAAPAPAK